jgi:hypothetical protein
MEKIVVHAPQIAVKHAMETFHLPARPFLPGLPILKSMLWYSLLELIIKVERVLSVNQAIFSSKEPHVHYVLPNPTARPVWRQVANG